MDGRGSFEAGISCPSCSGTLVVHVRAHAPPEYRCRVGHAFAPFELISGMEYAVDRILWSAVATVRELVQVLEDTRNACSNGDRAAFAERTAALREAADQLELLARSNRAVGLPDPGPAVP